MIKLVSRFKRVISESRNSKVDVGKQKNTKKKKYKKSAAEDIYPLF